MTDDPTPTEVEPATRISIVAFVLAGASFIPLLGIAPGLIALAWASVSGKAGSRVVVILALCGMGLTGLIYGGLHVWSTRLSQSESMASMTAQLTRGVLLQNVEAIELFQRLEGRYPDTLAEIRQRLPDSIMLDSAEAATRPFFYKRSGDGYYLRALGPDGRSFTADDIVPNVGTVPPGRIGLLLDRQA